MKVRRNQYVNSMDIFVMLDDVLHNAHRPLVEKETQLCGINAAKQLASNIINTLAHYCMWAAKNQIKATVWGIYTSNRSRFKNSIYLDHYRDHHKEINDPANQKFFFVNDAIINGMPIAHTICDYVQNVHMIDSHYLEPSMLPLYLHSQSKREWGMIVSRDHYDLQYAYRDKWLFVSPKGENTRMIARNNLWRYLGDREHIPEIGSKAAFYHHDLFPLALAVTGNKLRSIPRLQRVGWKTIFKYLEEITEKETESLPIIASRFLKAMRERGIKQEDVEANLRAVSIEDQEGVLTQLDQTPILQQIKTVSDHAALASLSHLYFEEFPLNVPFLTASYQSERAFFG